MQSAHYRAMDIPERDLGELYALAIDPRTRVDQLWRWLQGKGCPLSRSSAHRFLRAVRSRSCQVFPAGIAAPEKLEQIRRLLATLDPEQLRLVGELVDYLCHAGRPAE